MLSPPHNNSGHQQQQHQQSTRGGSGASTTSTAAATSASVGASGGNERSVSSSGAGVSAGENNIQITQPISAPSSPLASPGALIPAPFCLPSSSTSAVVATSNGSGSYVCPNGVNASNMSYANVGASNANDTADPNWQATKATVLERNAAMFNNELMSDVTFIVGDDFDTVQTIPAHKYILATGSSVFYAMFYGGLAENKQEIKVPDVEPSAFLTLLSQSRLFEEPELMQRCWEVIDAQAEMAIKSEDFVDIDLKHLNQFYGVKR
ncbi:hypothetical protein EVAR_68645_1 [Eumeta japonica]|uniref:BTB domain-containing protein n=1 Tax=Eumeta variegata TaxID=151549 RepID=A0A4C2AB75_EUMVA|nr:hypothetical protein EVAR_68645_1 [Eumeta japonica]